MGLRRWDPAGRRAAGWVVPAAAAGAALVAALPGEKARMLLRYDRTEIAAGELWRLLSGHFVHLDLSHLLLNLAGLLLVWILVGRAFRPLGWAIVLLASIVAIDAGFWWLLSGLDWYVGLSGALHGLFAAGLVGSVRQRPIESALLGLGLAAKLAWEQVGGSLPGTSEFVAGAVITEAHLYGAIGGLVAGVLLVALRAARGAAADPGSGAI
jgi:rhomboid family GlyGly-CTERM serine protease